jgi:hypothetical protein
MKKTLLMAAGLMLISLPVYSQSSGDSDTHGQSYGRQGRDLEDFLRDVTGDAPGQRLRRGAAFLLRSGDTTLAVRCDPQENMRACVDAGTTLLERARSMISPGGAAATPAPR